MLTTPSNERVLKEILNRLRKRHPSIRLRLSVEYSNPVNQLVTRTDSVNVRFHYQNKPVKAQKVIIAANCARSICVGINEPYLSPDGVRSNGIVILGGTNNPHYVELNSEIEWISVGLLTTTVGNSITVGYPPITGISGTAFGGHVAIYAWGVSQADLLESE